MKLDPLAAITWLLLGIFLEIPRIAIAQIRRIDEITNSTLI